MGKTSLLKTTMKKTFLFLPLFFVSLAIGMDHVTTKNVVYKKSPYSLQYLAAIKIPENQIPSLKTKFNPEAINKFDQWIQSEKKRKEKNKEASTNHYNQELTEICKKEKTCFTLKELYAIRPQLIDTRKKELFELCLEHGNWINGGWLLETFPDLADTNLFENLKKCVIKNCPELFKMLLKTNPEIIFQKNEKGQTYLSEILEHGRLWHSTPVSRWLLLDKTKNSPEALAWGIAHRDIIMVKNHMCLALSELHKKTAHSNDAYIIKELFKDLVLSGDSNSPESLTLIKLLLTNQDFKHFCVQELKKVIFLDTWRFIPNQAYALVLHHSQPLDTQIMNHLSNALANILGNIKDYYNEKDYEAIKILINYGAKPFKEVTVSTSDYHGGFYHHQEPAMKVAMGTASRQNSSHGRKIIDFILSRFPQKQWPTNPIHFAGAHHFIDLFVKHGFDINALDADGYSPLFSFIRKICSYYEINNFYKSLETVEQFLKLGADPNIPIKKEEWLSKYTVTPLAYVLQEGENTHTTELANLLKFYGAVKKLPAKPRRWQTYQVKAQESATFKTIVNKQIKTSLNVGNPFSYIAAAQAFKNKAGQIIPKPSAIDDKKMEDID